MYTTIHARVREQDLKDKSFVTHGCKFKTTSTAALAVTLQRSATVPNLTKVSGRENERRMHVAHKLALRIQINTSVLDQFEDDVVLTFGCCYMQSSGGVQS